MDDIKDLYRQDGTRLHPDTERLIRAHINRNADSEFSTFDGPPGTHAEIQALNDLYIRAGGADNISSGSIATVRTGNGSDFRACSNCAGILNGVPQIERITDP